MEINGISPQGLQASAEAAGEPFAVEFSGESVLAGLPGVPAHPYSLLLNIY